MGSPRSRRRAAGGGRVLRRGAVPRLPAPHLPPPPQLDPNVTTPFPSPTAPLSPLPNPPLASPTLAARARWSPRAGLATMAAPTFIFEIDESGDRLRFGCEQRTVTFSRVAAPFVEY